MDLNYHRIYWPYAYKPIYMCLISGSPHPKHPKLSSGWNLEMKFPLVAKSPERRYLVPYACRKMHRSIKWLRWSSMATITSMKITGLCCCPSIQVAPTGCWCIKRKRVPSTTQRKHAFPHRRLHWLTALLWFLVHITWAIACKNTNASRTFIKSGHSKHDPTKIED